MFRSIANQTYKAARRVVIAVVGATVLLLGVIMLVTPGPGLIVIPLGLAILSIEFAWARSWLRKVRQTISNRTAKDQAQGAEAHRERAQPPKDL